MKKSLLCIGLDSDYEKLPEAIKKNNSLEKSIFNFNKEIIDSTHDLVLAYKPNTIFYTAYGISGLKALKKTNEYIKKKYPKISIIADCKRSEMFRGAELTAKELFEELLFDAFTVTPWFGHDTIEPYQQYKDKAVFILCHDSNPSAPEIQDVELKNGKFLYEYVTELVQKKWNKNRNVFIEAGLTFPRQLQQIRRISGDDMIILSVGLGLQGGKLEDIVYGLNAKGTNLIIGTSRDIIFASQDKDFSDKARDKAKEIYNNINIIRSKFVKTSLSWYNSVHEPVRRQRK